MDSMISEFSRAAGHLLMFSKSLEMILVSQWPAGAVAPEVVYKSCANAPGSNSGFHRFANL